MKKLSIVLCALVATTCVSLGQDLKKFRVGLGLGYALPMGVDGVDAGILLGMEPS